MEGPGTYDFDYVYLSGETGEFENVVAKLEVNGAKMQLRVDSQRVISADDIAVLFDGIKGYTLKRLNICYATDTEVILNMCQKPYSVTYSNGAYMVAEVG